MAVKGKKRTGENSDAPPQMNETQQPLKKKIKTEVKAESNGLGETKKAEIKKIKKERVVKVENEVIPKKEEEVDKKNVTSNSKDEAVKKGAELAALIKHTLKKKEKKLKAKALLEPGSIKETVEELEQRIQKIESREEKSNRARRLLAALKKKLRIKQGTYVPPAPPSSRPTMTKSTKRKLRRQLHSLKKKDNNSENEEVPVEEVKNKAVDAANAVKGIKVKSIDKVLLKNDKVLAQINNKAEKKKTKEVSKSKKLVVDDEKEEEGKNDEKTNESMNISIDSTSNIDNEDEESEDKVEIKKPKNNKLNGKTEQGNLPLQKKSRYVLFVGNLPYTATAEDIKKHFLTKVKEVVDVRIATDGPNNSPRGFAHLELSNKVDYEKALSLHHSNISGRRINVQYSGGSKDSNKKSEVIAKNKKLHALRKEGKLAGSIKDSQKRNARRNKMNNQKN